MAQLKIRGARACNLQALDLDVPLHSLVVITGPSASDTHALAFGIIAAEGQRRLSKLLAPGMDELAEGVVRPDVDLVQGLPATFACEHTAPHWNPYCTVATAMDLADDLAWFFLRCGRDCGTVPPGMSASLLSFRSAAGRCMDCGGLGERASIAADSLVPNVSLSLREGAIAPWHDKNPAYFRGLLETLCRDAGIDMEAPWSSLSAAAREILLAGQPEGDFRGVVFDMERRLARAGEPAHDGGDALEWLRPYLRSEPCQSCSGSRWSAEASLLRVAGMSIADVHNSKLEELPAIVARLSSEAGAPAQDRSSLRQAIEAKLLVASDLGLDHLPLGRSALQVSAGESKRLRLAALLSCGLRDLLFVLDDPTAGLPAGDSKRVLALLRRTIAAGNSVILVSHDRLLIENADKVIDLGLGAQDASP